MHCQNLNLCQTSSTACCGTAKRLDMFAALLGYTHDLRNGAQFDACVEGMEAMAVLVSWLQSTCMQLQVCNGMLTLCKRSDQGY